jgi:NADP-dependent 3-hydroxy acid dehydrogenase YdfG
MRKSTWNLTGKSVLITGAANGIGAATTRLLAVRKTHLSLVDIQGSALRKLALDLGVGAICHEVDISQREALDEAIVNTLERFGHIEEFGRKSHH